MVILMKVIALGIAISAAAAFDRTFAASLIDAEDPQPYAVCVVDDRIPQPIAVMSTTATCHSAQKAGLLNVQQRRLPQQG